MKLSSEIIVNFVIIKNLFYFFNCTEKQKILIMDISEIRKTFPHIEAGQIYFNHASMGPISLPVREELNNFLDSRSTDLKNSFELFSTAGISVKEKIGRMLNCKSSQLSWVGNVSDAMNILANGIEWESGDRIIVNNIEFPANVYPFLNLANKGVVVDFVKSKKGIINFEDIESAITNRTKLITISLVQFLSGYRTDIEKLGKLCSERGIIFSVDAIQGAGVVKIDVQKSNIDFLTGGSHKWIMGLTGASYFYVSDKLNQLFSNYNVGWQSVKDPWNILDYNLELKESAEKFQTGTMNMIGVIAFNKSLELFESVGYESIEKLVISNTNYFIERLIEIGVSPLLKEEDNKNKAGIISFYIENPKRLLLKLRAKNIVGELREGLIRMSPHFYNTKEEIKTVVNEISKSIV